MPATWKDDPTTDRVLLDAARQLRAAARLTDQAARLIGHGPLSAGEGRRRLREAHHNITAALARFASYDPHTPGDEEVGQ